MTQRPTFFLSSTIYDFRDLRSAIKYSLEERGCRVLASEFNDFGAKSEHHSYEACLENIEQADYFILLIGSRVGGWFDESNRVSITQQEYRTAYELHRSGKIKLVSFVREEVWQLREDRKELKRFLSDLHITDIEKQEIASAPSKFATDAEFISSFISEVGRNTETLDSVKSGKAKPTGNWIHRFRDFRDIHDVIQPLAFTGLTSEEAAYRQALQSELLVVMSLLLGKYKSDVIDFRPSLKRGLSAHPISKEMRENPFMAVDLPKWHEFTNIFFQILAVKLEPIVIRDALTSTIFLNYDASAGAYVQSPAYDALAKLCDEIRRFNDAGTAETLSLLGETSPRALGRKTGSANVPTIKAATLYGLAHRWINVLNLSEALILHLAGHRFSSPELMPFSPIVGMEDSIQSERVSPSELRAALGIA